MIHSDTLTKLKRFQEPFPLLRRRGRRSKPGSPARWPARIRRPNRRSGSISIPRGEVMRCRSERSEAMPSGRRRQKRCQAPFPQLTSPRSNEGRFGADSAARPTRNRGQPQARSKSLRRRKGQQSQSPCLRSAGKVNTPQSHAARPKVTKANATTHVGAVAMLTPSVGHSYSTSECRNTTHLATSRRVLRETRCLPVSRYSS